MNYYIDTEFLEGTQKENFPISLFRKETPNTIDLISIGIVAEDGREYYAVSKDFNLKEAWNRYDIESFDKQDNLLSIPRKVYWIRENVLKSIWIDLFLLHEADFTFLKGKAYDQFEKELKNGEHNKLFTFKSLNALIKRYGKTNKQIAEEIISFVYPEAEENRVGYTPKQCIDRWFSSNTEKPQFYAYYADYDWVAFCWLFGKMMNLPKGFPKYCFDIKQLMDEKAYGVVKGLCFGDTKQEEEKMAINSISGQVEAFKTFTNYPKQENEHNALADARWNKKLHEFLNKL